ncbi:ABC transporter substrate binding protein [Planctomycetota bacterium]
MKRFCPRMTIRFLFWMFLLSYLVTGSIRLCRADEEPQTQRLLHLFSYHSGHGTFPMQMRGLTNVLEPAGIQFDTELFDLKRHNTPEHRQYLYDILANKLSHLPEDYYAGIITADDVALLFVLEHRDTLFAGLPVVFDGVNDWDLALAQNENNNVTGVIEAVSLRENVAVAKQLQPQLQTLYFVVDNSWTGATYRQEVERLGQSYQGVTLRFFDLHDMTWAALAHRFRDLQSGEAALVLNQSRDMNGDPSQVVGGIRKICQEAAQPVYVANENSVGKWAVGGHLLNHQLQAEMAAKMMLRILAGTPVQQIPVQEESPNRYVFDFKELTRYGIPLSRLPVDAEIINQPESFLSQHYSAILKIAGLVAVVGLFLLTVNFIRERQMHKYNRVLTAEVAKRRETEKELLEYQSRLKTLASEMALAEERQRRHLAGLLHDGVGQSLALTKMKLQCLQSQDAWETIQDELDDVCDTLTYTMNDLRTLSFELSSPILKELGLEKAVKHFLYDHVQEEHGIAVEYLDDGQAKPLHDDDREMLFRSVRELLMNTIKHAHASQVRVELKRQAAGLTIRIEDDGVGCDARRLNNPNVRSGYGLFSIRERLDQRGGILAFDSRPGHGCKATIKVPACWSA